MRNIIGRRIFDIGDSVDIGWSPQAFVVLGVKPPAALLSRDIVKGALSRRWAGLVASISP